jgi:hypothetical protein
LWAGGRVKASLPFGSSKSNYRFLHLSYYPTISTSTGSPEISKEEKIIIKDTDIYLLFLPLSSIFTPAPQSLGLKGVELLFLFVK